ncbi:hypothetical protein ES703_02130 [subsurface metagenome]
MELGIIALRGPASFRNQAELISKAARAEGYGVIDLDLASAVAGPPRWKWDKFIALIPLWRRYLMDMVRFTAWISRTHLIYGPVDGPFQMNIGLFQIMKNMNFCAPSKWCARMITQSAEVPCSAVPHGIDHTNFKFSEDRVEAQRKVWLDGKKDKTILFSNLTPLHRKGFPHLCKALGILHERLGSKFLMVLHTSLKTAKKHYPNLEKTPCLKIEDTYNTLPFRAIALKTVAADIYVNPSLQEGFGLTILEAMAAKTVVVTSDAPAVNELVSDKEGFIFPITTVKQEKWANGAIAHLHEYKPQSLADAMERAITEKALRKEKAAVAYQKSLSYDYRKVYHDLIALCD